MRKEQKVPKLRFPGFEGEWVEEPLEKTYSFKVTNSYSREQLNYEHGTTKNIHYGDIHKKFPLLLNISKELVPFVNPEIDLKKITQENYCQIGDVVIADASENLEDVGKAIEIVVLDSFPVLAGLHTILARPQPRKLGLGFGGFLFASPNFRRRIQKESQGTKVLSISSRRLGGIPISLPKLPEQEKIASFLAAVDDKLRLMKARLELLKSYKRGLMQKIFSQEIRFKDEDGKDFPDWEERRLGEVLKIGSGRDYKHLGIGDVPVCGTGGYMLSVDQFLFDGETVCIGRKGTIDKPFYHVGKIWTVDTLFFTHSFKNVIPKFVYLLFSIENWKAHNEASGVPSLSKATIEKIPVPIPCVKEQVKISEAILSIEALEQLVAKSFESLTTWKQGLLQNMFV